MNEVWVRFTYTIEGISEIVGVYTTAEAAMGEYGHIGWELYPDGDYLSQGSGADSGEMIKHYKVMGVE